MKQTAVEFIEGKSDSFDTQMRRKFFYQSTVEQLMIDFAKYHVEAALKAAQESTLEYDFTEEITNSYPLENIK
jgi:hypothetical protein